MSKDIPGIRAYHGDDGQGGIIQTGWMCDGCGCTQTAFIEYLPDMLDELHDELLARCADCLVERGQRLQREAFDRLRESHAALEAALQGYELRKPKITEDVANE